MTINLTATLPKKALAFFIGIFLTIPAFANEPARPRTPRELPIGTRTDRGYRIKNAKVVIFNRTALERDFPKLRGLPDHAIEAWILQNFAYVNARQEAFANIRNTTPDLDYSDVKNLYVPPGVGRGAMMEVDGGMVDVKGCGNTWWSEKRVAELVEKARSSAAGLLAVRAEDHSSGLEIYNLAAAEYLRQFEIQLDYDRRSAQARGEFQTNESYFLIDNGFDVLYPDQRYRAFSYGRQAHFGRTANNRPLKDEIYRDKGKFQETYTGSRIDFGGARTNSESEIAYHEAMANLRPDEVASYILKQERRLVARVNTERRAALFTPLTAVAVVEALRNTADLMVSPNSEAIGVSKMRMDPNWLIDAPYVAAIKAKLFTMPADERKKLLKLVDDRTLGILFSVSKYVFQMPLTEDVYEYGMIRKGTRSSAVGAAVAVLDRFPRLIKPAVKYALKDLDSSGYWTPSETHALISTPHPFAGYQQFLFDVLKSPSAHAKATVLHRLKEEPPKDVDAEMLIRWVEEHEQNTEVIETLLTNYPERRARYACRTAWGR